jgi:hypothetical protein
LRDIAQRNDVQSPGKLGKVDADAGQLALGRSEEKQFQRMILVALEAEEIGPVEGRIHDGPSIGEGRSPVVADDRVSEQQVAAVELGQVGLEPLADAQPTSSSAAGSGARESMATITAATQILIAPPQIQFVSSAICPELHGPPASE